VGDAEASTVVRPVEGEPVIYLLEAGTTSLYEVSRTIDATRSATYKVKQINLTPVDWVVECAQSETDALSRFYVKREWSFHDSKSGVQIDIVSNRGRLESAADRLEPDSDEDFALALAQRLGWASARAVSIAPADEPATAV
jgi:hypothetical protein